MYGTDHPWSAAITDGNKIDQSRILILDPLEMESNTFLLFPTKVLEALLYFPIQEPKLGAEINQLGNSSENPIATD